MVRILTFDDDIPQQDFLSRVCVTVGVEQADDATRELGDVLAAAGSLPVLATWECCVSLCENEILGNVYDQLEFHKFHRLRRYCNLNSSCCWFSP
jgi:hypothetical protein